MLLNLNRLIRTNRTDRLKIYYNYEIILSLFDFPAHPRARVFLIMSSVEEHFLLLLLKFCLWIVEHLLDLLNSHGMIEINVMFKPLFCNRFISGNHSCINRLKVLQSTHIAYEVISKHGDRLIVLYDCKRVPDMLNLWIISCCNVQVSINFSKKSFVNCGVIFLCS